MGKAALVHEVYAFCQLPNDLTRGLFRERGSRVHEAPQVSKGKIFHGDEDGLGIIVPPICAHEVWSIL